MPNITCKQCGVVFIGKSRGKYCSIPCANIGMRKANPSTRYPKRKVPVGHPLRDKHGQCMHHRLVLWNRVGPGAHPCPLWKRNGEHGLRKQKTCQHCGVEFLTYGTGIYCSQVCHHTHRRGKPRRKADWIDQPAYGPS